MPDKFKGFIDKATDFLIGSPKDFVQDHYIDPVPGKLWETFLDSLNFFIGLSEILLLIGILAYIVGLKHQSKRLTGWGAISLLFLFLVKRSYV